MNHQELESFLSRRPFSPLFARLANQYLISDDEKKTIELCNLNLQHYPNYPTAHLVLAKCYAKKKDFFVALHHLKIAEKFLPNNSKLRQLHSEWEILADISVPSDSVEQISGNIQDQTEILTEQTEPVLEQIETSPQLEITQSPAAEIISEKGLPVEAVKTEEPHSILEKKLLNETQVEIAVTPQSIHKAAQDETLPDEDDINNRIISKTLAEIYAGQGEYDEAIKMYRLLKRQRPEHKVEFDQRIEELEKKRIV
jgi:tetratricopeptide (TPR) repeat protein